jgi:hypothetical protein
MFLNPNAFNVHLAHMGQDFLWRKATACPCLSATSGSPDPRCPNCGGKGQIWAAPVNCVAGVANQATQQNWAKFGLYQSGDMVVSIPENSAMYDMSRFDRVVMLDATEGFSIALRHGAPAERILGPVQAVTRVFWYDTDGVTIVEGGLPTLAPNGAPTWSTGEPPAGRAYSVSGTSFVEYFCFEKYPSNRGEHHGLRLPKRNVLRKFDLFGQRSGGLN